MDRVLSQSLSPAEGEVAEAELEQLEADYARLEAADQLPSVPKVRSMTFNPVPACRIPLMCLCLMNAHVLKLLYCVCRSMKWR